MIVGRDNGTISFYENIGTAESADWLELQNFFGAIDVGSDAVPSLVDYDNDGDYDLIAGNISGEVKFFYNNTFDWQEDTSITSTIIVDQNAAPACADLDGDGDFDLVLGNYEGTFSYFKNQNPTDVKGETVTPKTFALFQNYPNPFNPNTVISWQLPVSSFVTLMVYDMLGNEVATLVNEEKSAGTYEVEFHSAVGNQQLASGIYFYQLRTDDFVATKKLVMMK